MSSATGSRGDTITLTVSLDQTLTDIDSGGIIFSYDTSALEYVSGQWNVSNTMLAVFQSSTEGAFMCNIGASTTVSGTLCSITFKIKDDAAFTTSSISINVSLNNMNTGLLSISSRGGSVTVQCSHSFTAETVAEQYLNSEATCINKATYFKSCSVCGEKGTDTFETGDVLPHSYVGAIKADTDKTHSFKCINGCGQYGNATACADADSDGDHKCDDCGNDNITAHKPGAAATCQSNQTCTECNKELNAKLPHSYTGEVKANGDKTHSYKCVNGCGQYDGTVSCADKTGDNDHACDTCGNANITSHTPANDDGDCTTAILCTECGEVTTPAASSHTPSAAATCKEAQLCTVCNKELNPKLPHSYTGEVKANSDKTHSYKCVNGCNEYGGTVACSDADNDGNHTCDSCGNADITNHVPGAAATCQSNQTCTECGTELEAKKEHSYTGEVKANNDGTHSFKCINGCNQYGGTVNCSGGEATCTEKAACSTCSQTYGSVDANNHAYSSDLKQGESTHYYECSRCQGKKNETTHEYKNHTSNGDDTHTGTCICGKTERGNCTGNDASATCQAKATCTTCGGAYGAYADHDYDLTAWGYCRADGHAHMCKTSGCTAHDTVVPHTSSGEATEDEPEVCTECNYVINPSTGHVTHTPESEWSMDETHHWKECTGCNTQAFQKGEHVYDNACDVTCNTCGYVRQTAHDFQMQSNDAEHWQQCSACGMEKANSRDAHSGGTATCVAKAVCTYCQSAYGEMNEINHAAQSFHYEANNDRTHKKLYDCCNAVADAAESCSGGSANCQTKACCALCGVEYGTLAEHDYDMTAWGYQGADGHAHTCKVCGNMDAVAAHTSSGAATEERAEICTVCQHVITPATGHSTHTPGDKWESDSQYHWHGCVGCAGQQLEKGEHIFDNDCDSVCNTCGYAREAMHSYSDLKHSDTEHWYECSCGAEKAGGRAFHNGGSATCTTKAKCDVCGVEYGELAVHTYAAQWSCDDGKHWHECVCGVKSDEAAHTYGGDNLCDICGYQTAEQGSENEGLSGGAIAVIIVVSVLGLSGGAFALYWFVLRKKYF